MSTPKKEPLGVFRIEEYQAKNPETGKTEIMSHFMRLGTAFENSDGSFNLLLSAIPAPQIRGDKVEYRLHIRKLLPKTGSSQPEGSGSDNLDENSFFPEDTQGI